MYRRNPARIRDKSLTTYMTSSTNFAEARTATMNAADALYGVGSPESIPVAQAWAACGILQAFGSRLMSQPKEGGRGTRYLPRPPFFTRSDFFLFPISQFRPVWFMMPGIWHAVNPNAKWLLG